MPKSITYVYLNLALQITTAVVLAAVFIVDEAPLIAAAIIGPAVVFVLMGMIAAYQRKQILLMAYMATAVILIAVEVYHLCICLGVSELSITSSQLKPIIGKTLSAYLIDVRLANEGLPGNLRPTLPKMFLIIVSAYGIHIWFQAVGFILAYTLPIVGSKNDQKNRESLYSKTRRSMYGSPLPSNRNHYSSQSSERKGSSSSSGYQYQPRRPYIPPESIHAPQNPKYNINSKYNANEPVLVSKKSNMQKKADYCSSSISSKYPPKKQTTSYKITNEENSYGSLGGYYDKTLEAPITAQAAVPAPEPSTFGFENLYATYIKPLLPTTKLPRRVIKRHLPTLDDEIYLEIGDMVDVEEVFEDNWAVGTNRDTEKYGAFPMTCLEDTAKKSNRHESKFYGR